MLSQNNSVKLSLYLTNLIIALLRRRSLSAYAYKMVYHLYGKTRKSPQYNSCSMLYLPALRPACAFFA